jgi:hypothetical protein
MSVIERVHNPSGRRCGCPPECICQRSTLGRTFRWYIPGRFHTPVARRPAFTPRVRASARLRRSSAWAGTRGRRTSRTRNSLRGEASFGMWRLPVPQPSLKLAHSAMLAVGRPAAVAAAQASLPNALPESSHAPSSLGCSGGSPRGVRKRATRDGFSRADECAEFQAEAAAHDHGKQSTV